MILLVGMVITKAVISMDQKADAENRAKTDVVSLNDFSERSFDLVSPIADAAGSFYSVANYATLPTVSVQDDFSDFESDLSLETKEDEDFAEEVIPLESYSNTGYGRWIGETENSEKVDESVPLDNGNTISESMSRLFPRIQ
ncbi:MAG: hypothetical protein ABJH69_07670 [Crocinitomicaceae bacterium]